MKTYRTESQVDRLLAANKTNINTVNVDGLTALHQACIDNNLEMAEFLIERGIDLNRGKISNYANVTESLIQSGLDKPYVLRSHSLAGDNEGWTPLHATASCGYVSIAQLLIEKVDWKTLKIYRGLENLSVSSVDQHQVLTEKHFAFSLKGGTTGRG